jgi:hypothetical protein
VTKKGEEKSLRRKKIKGKAKGLCEKKSVDCVEEEVLGNLTKKIKKYKKKLEREKNEQEMEWSIGKR